jgi:hypothetical protein
MSVKRSCMMCAGMPDDPLPGGEQASKHHEQ